MTLNIRRRKPESLRDGKRTKRWPQFTEESYGARRGKPGGFLERR